MPDIAEFLLTCPAFSEVPRNEIRRMADLFRAETYKTGTIILEQGKISPAVFVIRSGGMTVRIT